MLKHYFFVINLLFLFLIIFSPQKIQAQCAGNDASAEICDILNITSQTVNLYGYLGGNPVTGGTWSDDNSSGGLNTITGILNAQEIKESGVYKYTYSVEGIAGCADNSATITLTIGGFTGITGPNASICSDLARFNLFQVINGSYLAPQSNGIWFNNTNNSSVADHWISPSQLGPGNFQFTYTIPPIGSCAAASSTAFITIYKAANPGRGRDLLLCNDSTSNYIDLDLNSLLDGEDPGGIWTENSGTSEISSKTDRFVNLERIYQSFGAGDYSFTYTVLPSNLLLCTKEQTAVTITIEKKLDFTGATIVLNSSICESSIATANYSVTLNQGIENIPNGQYNIAYSVSGISGATDTVTATFSNGVLNFPIDRKYFQQVGQYNFAITDIKAVASKGACIAVVNNLATTLHLYPTPVLTGAKLTSSPICQDNDVTMIVRDAALLTDGNYSIVYNLSGVNRVSSQVIPITVIGGAFTFTIPANLLLLSGTTTVTITNITNTTTLCTNSANSIGTIVVYPLPDPTNAKIVVKDYCFGESVAVALSGLGGLTRATISYNLSGNNVATTQTQSLLVNGGKANFTIPSPLLLNTGTTTLAITNLTNDDTACNVAIVNLSDDFVLNSIPLPPASSNREFCKTDGATVANLVPHGAQYRWFKSGTTIPLADSFVLATGNYYVIETSSSQCSSAPTSIAVLVNDVVVPVLVSNGENFCGIDNPTIADLSNKTNVASSVSWYDSLANGNLLRETDALQDNQTYYGLDFSTNNNCFSSNYLQVTVTLTDCSNSLYAFFIPDGFSPNGDGVNDTFTIPEIDYLYPDYTLEIFNRYGNVLFKGNKNKPNWDGRNSAAFGFKDGVVPNGVYFYVIHFNRDDRAPQQGHLYLNR